MFQIPRMRCRLLAIHDTNRFHCTKQLKLSTTEDYETGLRKDGYRIRIGVLVVSPGPTRLHGYPFKVRNAILHGNLYMVTHGASPRNNGASPIANVAFTLMRRIHSNLSKRRKIDAL